MVERGDQLVPDRVRRAVDRRDREARREGGGVGTVTPVMTALELPTTMRRPRYFPSKVTDGSVNALFV